MPKDLSNKTTQKQTRTSASERRREDRLPGGNSRFILRRGKDAAICKVVNLSRLGLGIELPIQSTGELYENLVPGEKVAGVLHVGKNHLDTEAVVRVRRDAFLGLEYLVQSSSFFKELRALLNPKFIASTIVEIAPQYLAHDIEMAYRGDEFELLVFKSGASNSGKAIQFFSDGKFLEIVDGHARFVPSPLVRTTGGTGNFDFVQQFASLSDSYDKTELKEYFTTLESIFSVWDAAPTEVVQLIKQHTHKLK